MTLSIEDRAELEALARRADTGEKWAEIARLEAEWLEQEPCPECGSRQAGMCFYCKAD